MKEGGSMVVERTEQVEEGNKIQLFDSFLLCCGNKRKTSHTQIASQGLNVFLLPFLFIHLLKHVKHDWGKNAKCNRITLFI